jgi:hypothetical protein
MNDILVSCYALNFGNCHILFVLFLSFNPHVSIDFDFFFPYKALVIEAVMHDDAYTLLWFLARLVTDIVATDDLRRASFKLK